MIQPSSENVIVTALRRGQVRRAVGMLVDSYNDDLYCYCASLLGPASGGRVYQQALAGAIGNLDSYQGQSSLRAWLFAIARGAILEHQWRHPALYPGAREQGYCPLPEPGSSCEGEQPSNAETVDLTILPQATQEILQLRLWHGLRLREVAFMTGQPVDEVRRHASDALTLFALTGGRPNQAPS